MSSNYITKHDVVKEARSWIGTRFLHQGRIKHNQYDLGGCDCLGLILGVSDNLNIKCKTTLLTLSKIYRADYSSMPNPQELQDGLDNSLLRIQKTDMQIGDILLLNVGKQATHLGILGKLHNHYTIIHATEQVGKVKEHRISKYIIKQAKHVYRYYKVR